MAIETKGINPDALDSAYGDRMRESIDYFLENSKVKSNGVREVPKSAYNSALERHGVTHEEIKRVNEAVDFENTAAAHVALIDLEAKIAEASPEQMTDADYRKNLTSTVRLPTFGGNTEVELRAEKFTTNPFRGEGEAPEPKASYGVLRTSINTKSRVHKDFHTEAQSRIRKSLGIASDDRD